MAAAGSAYLAWLLLIVDSFLLPVTPVGQAVPGSQIYQYIPSSSSIVFHMDLRSIKHQFDKSLDQLGKMPVVEQNPMFKMMFDQLNQTIKRGILQLEQTIKVVKIDQIRFITVGIAFKERFRNPEILVVVHGELTQNMVDGIIGMRQGKSKFTKSESHGMTFYFNENNREPSLAWVPTGQILLGTAEPLRRLSIDGIEKLAEGSLRHQLVQQYKPQHALAAGIQQSHAMRREYRQVPPMVRSLLEDMTSLYMAAWGGGSQLTLWSKTPATTKRYALMLKGMGQLGVASDYLRRGLINMADAVIAPSNQPVNNPALDTILQNKDVIFAYIRQFFSSTILSYQVKTTPNSAQLEFHGNGGVTIPLIGLLGGIGFARQVAPRRVRYKRAYPQPPATAPMKPQP